MIPYEVIVEHLHGESCNEMPELYEAANPPYPALSTFRNLINFNTCQIPVEPIGVLMACHIFDELKINPMPEYYDDHVVYMDVRNKAGGVVADFHKKEKKNNPGGELD